MGAGGVRGVCHAGCGLCALTRARALRGVICAPAARGRGGRAAQSAADRQKARPVHSKEPQWDKFQDYLKGEVLNRKGTIVSLRFCSKTIPERGRRALRRRSGERSVALQELSENVGHRLVSHIANKRKNVCTRVLCV